MKFLLGCTAMLAATFSLATESFAAEIEGKVIRVSDGAVEVATDSELFPNPGDQAVIYYKIPGLDDPVQVASGRVFKLEGKSIHIKIEQPAPKPASGQLARIISEHPRRLPAQVERDPSMAATAGTRPSTPDQSNSSTAPQPAAGGGAILRGHVGLVTAIAFSPDGQRILSVNSVQYRDNLVTVFLWDAAAGREIRHFDLEAAPVASMAFMDGGKIGTCVDTGGTLHRWNLVSGTYYIPTIGSRGPVRAVAYSPDASLVAIAYTRVRDDDGAAIAPTEALSFFPVNPDAGRGKTLPISRPISTLAFSDDAKRLVAVDDAQVSLWDLGTEKLQSQSQIKVPSFSHMAVSRDGRVALLDPPGPTAAGEKQLRDFDNANAKRLLDSANESLRRLESQPDASANGSDAPIRVEVKVGEAPQVLERPPFDAQHFVRLVDLRTGKEIRKFDTPGLTPIDVALSPDGECAAAVSTNRLFVWNVSTGRTLLQTPVECCLKHVVFSPDSRALVAVNPDSTLLYLAVPK
jgi:WD40 repeat protein